MIFLRVLLLFCISYIYLSETDMPFLHQLEHHPSLNQHLRKSKSMKSQYSKNNFSNKPKKCKTIKHKVSKLKKKQLLKNFESQSSFASKLIKLSLGPVLLNSKILDEMQNAVKDQQAKLLSIAPKQFFSLIENEQNNSSEKSQRLQSEKQSSIETGLKDQQKNLQKNELMDWIEKDDLMAIGTAEEFQIYQEADFNQQERSSLFYEIQCSDLPANLQIRKMSSRLLSDNYENQQLLYSVEQIVLNPFKEDNENQEQFHYGH